MEALSVSNFDQIAQSIQGGKDETANRIIANIKKYGDIGMQKAKEAATEGAVSYILSKFSMNLIKFIGNKRLDVIDFEGTHGSVRHSLGSNWELKSLKEFDRAVPQEVLNRIHPATADQMVVWSPVETAPDPILSLPLPWNRTQTVKRLIFENAQVSHWYRISMKVVKIMEDVTEPMPSPYYAVVARWD